MIPLSAIPGAVLFAFTGLIVFAIASAILVRVLPRDLWERATENGDVAAAIVVAAFLVAIAWITAAAVH